MQSYTVIRAELQESKINKDPKEIKQQLIKYYGNLDSDSAYIQDINAVVRKAEFHLKKSILDTKLDPVFNEKLKTLSNREAQDDSQKKIIDKKSETNKFAVVLDFDDTLGSHAPSIIKSDFKNDKETVYNRYLMDNVPPITPTYQLYKLALELNVEVFVLSYRQSLSSSSEKNLRPYVIKNLMNNGIKVDERNVFLPNENEMQLDSIVYKTNVREKITADGYRIALVLGDQESDFPSGEAYRKDKGHFLLPNKLYGKFSLLGTQTHVTGTVKADESEKHLVDSSLQHRIA